MPAGILSTLSCSCRSCGGSQAAQRLRRAWRRTTRACRSATNSLAADRHHRRMLLFPADVLRPRRVDDHFVPEAEATQEPYALVDHNALSSGDADRGVA